MYGEIGIWNAKISILFLSRSRLGISAENASERIGEQNLKIEVKNRFGAKFVAMELQEG